MIKVKTFLTVIALIIFSWGFAAPFRVSGDCVEPAVKLIGAKQISTDIHEPIDTTAFCELVHDLQQKDILDGEVFIIKNNTILLHERSKDVALCAHNNEPQFLIGSLSKQFTAVALLRVLYDVSKGDTQAEKCAYVQQQLHLPLSTFLPLGAPVWNGSLPTWAHNVTLHHLLTHTSGIICSNAIIYENSGLDGVWRAINTPHTIAEIISMPAQKPLEFESGKKYAYSNEGYILLAEVVSAISGVPFTQYIHNMCNSIGMASTGHPENETWKHIIQHTCYASLVPGLVYSGTDLALREPSTELMHNFSNVRGSGGIISTVHDLIIWNNALHKEKTMLAQPLYELLITPNLANYGYGIWNKNGILFHGGKIDSYSSVMLYVPNEELLIIALCHVDDGETIEKIKFLLDTALQKFIINKSEKEEFVDKVVGQLEAKYFQKRGAKCIVESLMQQCFKN